MSEQFLSHNAYQKLGSAIVQLVYCYSHIQDMVNLKYRRSYGNDLEKIDITPLASDLELKVFLSKENPASVEYLNEAKKAAHTFIDACEDDDLVAYGIFKEAANRLNQLINDKYAILAMYESNKTNSFGAVYRYTVEKSYKAKHAESVNVSCDNMSEDNLYLRHFADCFNRIVNNDFTSIFDGYKALITDELFKSLDNHRGDKLNAMKDIVYWAFIEEVNRFNDDFNKIILSIINPYKAVRYVISI